MIDSTFYGRIDSNTANNPLLNLEVTGEAFEITFIKNPGVEDGNLILEYTGLPDENTLVVIDGIEYQFIYEFSGKLPATANGGNQVPPELSEADVSLITVIGYPPIDDGAGTLVPDPTATTRIVFAPTVDPDADLMNGLPNGALPLTVQNTDPEPVCFISGTFIETPIGPKLVDDLRCGDRVITVDGGVQPITWVASSMHTWPGSDEKHKPILIQRGALGHAAPTDDLIVSPQHHVVMKGALCAQMFGADEVLAPAKGLTGLAGVRVMSGKKVAEYFHILMSQHEILIAHGVETESFYPGPTSLTMLSAAQRAQLLAVVPALRDDPENGYGPTARKRITRRQAEQLVEAMKIAERKPEGAVS